MVDTILTREDAAARAVRRSRAFGDARNEFAAYLEYNKVLRSWFVAFGVGGPALFLVNEQLGKRLAASGQLELVAALFLAGAGSQVFGAVLNKISNWYVYRGTIEPGYLTTRRYRFFSWFVLQFWVDVAADIVSIACFGVATWLLVMLFGSSG
jgi:hypothetical protein